MNHHLCTTPDETKDSFQNHKAIIIMCGWPGTGKSTRARLLHKHLEKNRLLNRDDVRKRFISATSTDSNPGNCCKKIDSYLLQELEKSLKGCDYFILDGTFHTREKRERFYEFAKEHDCETIVVECTCTFETAYDRLNRQINNHEKCLSRPVKDVLEKYRESFQSPGSESEFATIIQLDTDFNKVRGIYFKGTPATSARKVCKFLKQPFPRCGEGSRKKSLPFAASLPSASHRS